MTLSPKFAAYARLVGAWLVSIYSVFSAQSVAPHLPVVLLGIMGAFGPVMTALQHWLSDPSTGTPPPPVPPAPPG